MNRQDSGRALNIAAVCVALSLILAAFLCNAVISYEDSEELAENTDPGLPETTLKMVICQKDQQKGRKALFIGYSYSLMQEFARSLDLKDQIGICDTWAESLYRLKGGEADIIAIPAKSDIRFDGLLATLAIDETSRWIVRRTDRHLLDEADRWIEEYNSSEKRETEHVKFLEPKKASCVSPYDSLIRIGAGNLGWDWKLLAAVIYQESHFHIEAISPHGAKGLCQFTDATAKRFKLHNVFDPEQSIKAGAAYLKRIFNMWHDYPPAERMNFTLASYNGGPGLILEAMDSARAYGFDPDSWQGVRQALVKISCDTTAEQPRNLMETANYVGLVRNKYRALSGRDQLTQSQDSAEAGVAE